MRAVDCFQYRHDRRFLRERRMGGERWPALHAEYLSLHVIKTGLYIWNRVHSWDPLSFGRPKHWPRYQHGEMVCVRCGRTVSETLDTDLCSACWIGIAGKIPRPEEVNS